MYLILFVAFCLFALIDFHKAILLYAPLRMFFHPGVCLRYESPAIMLDFACCSVLLALYVFHRKKRMPNHLILAYLLMLFCYVGAIFASTYPVMQAVPPMIGRIAWLLYGYLFFANLNAMKDIRFFHIAYFLCMVLMVGYGMFEYIIQENPVIDYQKAMSPTGMEGMVFGDGHERLGSIRCQSLSAISISYGAFCIIWICFAIIYSQFYKKIFSAPILYGFMCMCVIGAFSSGSKSPFILLLSFLGLYVFMARGNRKLKTFIITSAVVVAIVFGAFLEDFYMMIVDSSQSSTAGSDIPMRLMQMAAVGDLLDKHSWLFGLGAKGVMKAQLLNPAVLGAESVWLQLALEQGLMGCLAYIVMMISISRYGKSYMNTAKYRIFIIFIISWVLLNTVTSLPGIDLSFFMCLCFVMVAEEEIKVKTSKLIVRQ